jgi:hypothetical protein
MTSRQSASSTPNGSNSRNDGGIAPYLAVILVALVLGAGLALYVAGYRAEIMAILTQSPT